MGLAERLPDQPLALAVAEPAVAADAAALQRLAISLADEAWLETAAAALNDVATVGVTSLGWSTRRVLEMACAQGDVRTLVTGSRAVARGLGFLDLPVRLASPESAEVLVVPAVASSGVRLWMPAAAAEAVRSVTGARILTLLDPLTVLTPWAQRRFRPPAGVTAVSVGSATT